MENNTVSMYVDDTGLCLCDANLAQLNETI